MAKVVFACVGPPLPSARSGVEAHRPDLDFRNVEDDQRGGWNAAITVAKIG